MKKDIIEELDNILKETEDVDGLNDRQRKLEDESIPDPEKDYYEENRESNDKLKIFEAQVDSILNIFKPMKNTSILNLMSPADKKALETAIKELEGMIRPQEVKKG